MTVKRTRDVAQELGVNALKLETLIRYGKLPPPAKDSGGSFIWSAADVARARAALAKKGQRTDTANEG